MPAEIKLVILWDEVIGDIIEYVIDGLTKSRGTLLKDTLLIPLIQILEKNIKSLIEMFDTFPEYLYLHDALSFIFYFLYIGAIFSIVGYSVMLFIQWCYQYVRGNSQMVDLLRPIQKLVYLQVVQLLILPTMLVLLEQLPKMITWLNSLFFVQFNKELPTFYTLPITDEGILLQLIAMSLIFGGLLKIYYHYLSVGVKVLGCLVATYLRIALVKPSLALLEPLKIIAIEFFVTFFVQRLLISYLFEIAKPSETLIQLLYYGGCIILISFFPKMIIQGVVHDGNK